MSRILVAEDSPVNLALLTDLLELHGHEVLVARDGAEALEAARRERPDLVLLDLMMPRVDGFTVARALKGDPATRGLPVVALTALAMDGDERRAREAGCDAYVTKPIDTRALPGLLAGLLAPAGPAPAPAAAPPAAWASLAPELADALGAMADALDVLRRRPNDHAALRVLVERSHRVRGGAAAVGARPLADELARFEARARAAAGQGRLSPGDAEALRRHLVELHGLHARLAPGRPVG